MRVIGFYSRSLDAERAADMTLAEVADMPRTTGDPLAPVHVPADPFLDPAGSDDPAPF